MIVDATCKTGIFHVIRWVDSGAGKELSAAIFGEQLMSELPTGTYSSGKYSFKRRGHYVNITGVVERPRPVYDENREIYG